MAEEEHIDGEPHEHLLEPEKVIEIVDALWDSQEFSRTRDIVQGRRDLRRRLAGVNVTGIAEQLEHRTSGLEVNSDRFANRLRAASIRILVAAKKTTPGAKEAAQNVENFLYALYFDLRRKRSGRQRAPDDRAIRYQVSDFVGIRYLDWATDVRDKLFGGLSGLVDIKEMQKVFKKGFQGNPFELKAPNPTSVVWDDDYETIGEKGDVRISTIARLFPDDDDVSAVISSAQEKEGRNGTLQWYRLETCEYTYEVINHASTGSPDGNVSATLRAFPNPAGRPRYTFAPGEDDTGDEPWEYYRPLLGPLYPIAQLMNITGTLLMSSALQTGRAPYQRVKRGSQADDFSSIMQRPQTDRNVIFLTPDRAFWPDAGDGYEWAPVPVPDQSILSSAHAQLQSEFIAYGFPPVLSPDAPINAESGYDRARMMEGAQDFLSPPLEQNSAAWHELFLLAADTIREVGVSVTIPVMKRSQGEDRRFRPSITIKPEDFLDLDLEVRFESIPQVVRFAQAENDRRELQAKTMSRSTYMENRFDDPLREQTQIDDDMMQELAVGVANEFTVKFLQQQAPQIAAAAAQQLNFPTLRPERPAGGSVPGGGSPIVPPIQSQNGGGSIPAAGDGAVGVSE